MEIKKHGILKFLLMVIWILIVYNNSNWFVGTSIAILFINEFVDSYIIIKKG